MGLISSLIQFVNGQTAQATDVNANFDEIRTKFNSFAVLVDVAKTVTVQHTFQPASAQPPFILGANAQNQKVVGLEADKLDGQEGAYYQDAANLNAGSIPDARVPQSAVTQHQAALAIAAGSQLTGQAPIANGGTGANTAAGAFTALKQAATDAASGVAELATQAEVDAGTDADRMVTPDKLAGSRFGKRELVIEVFEANSDHISGDGAAYFRVPSALDGMNVTAVHAFIHGTAASGGLTTIQIFNVTGGSDILSTAITIDSGETDSDTAVTPPVIDTAQDDLADGDILRIDIDAVPATAGKGLFVTITAQMP
jgi:hypothetical protein